MNMCDGYYQPGMIIPCDGYYRADDLAGAQQALMVGMPDLSGMPGLGATWPVLTWEEAFRQDWSAFGASENREARRRTRRTGLLLAVPFLFVLIEGALAYFGQ